MTSIFIAVTFATSALDGSGVVAFVVVEELSMESSTREVAREVVSRKKKQVKR